MNAISAKKTGAVPWSIPVRPGIQALASSCRILATNDDGDGDMFRLRVIWVF